MGFTYESSGPWVENTNTGGPVTYTMTTTTGTTAIPPWNPPMNPFDPFVTEDTIGGDDSDWKLRPQPPPPPPPPPKKARFVWRPKRKILVQS